MIKKNIKELIKAYFFLKPTSRLRVRHTEKILKIPLPSVIRYCKELESEGILTTIKTGNIIFYTADRANESFLLEKKLFNIRQIFKSGLINYLRQELSNPVVVLFGSYVKGEDIEISDIDIYLETPSKKEISLDEFERKLQRKIQIFRHKNIQEIKNIHLVNNIINGITLNNYVKVLK